MEDEKDWTIEGFHNRAFHIDATNVNDHFVNFGAQYSYWGQKLCDAWESYYAAQREYNKTYALTFQEKRSEGGPGGKKLSEKDAKHLTELDPDVMAMEVQKDSAKVRVKRVQAILSALKEKRDGLQSAGAYAREEMRNGIEVKIPSTEEYPKFNTEDVKQYDEEDLVDDLEADDEEDL